MGACLLEDFGSQDTAKCPSGFWDAYKALSMFFLVVYSSTLYANSRALLHYVIREEYEVSTADLKFFNVLCGVFLSFISTFSCINILGVRWLDGGFSTTMSTVATSTICYMIMRLHEEIYSFGFESKTTNKESAVDMIKSINPVAAVSSKSMTLQKEQEAEKASSKPRRRVIQLLILIQPILKALRVVADESARHSLDAAVNAMSIITVLYITQLMITAMAGINKRYRKSRAKDKTSPSVRRRLKFQQIETATMKLRFILLPLLLLASLVIMRASYELFRVNTGVTPYEGFDIFVSWKMFQQYFQLLVVVAVAYSNLTNKVHVDQIYDPRDYIADKRDEFVILQKSLTPETLGIMIEMICTFVAIYTGAMLSCFVYQQFFREIGIGSSVFCFYFLLAPVVLAICDRTRDQEISVTQRALSGHKLRWYHAIKPLYEIFTLLVLGLDKSFLWWTSKAFQDGATETVYFAFPSFDNYFIRTYLPFITDYTVTITIFTIAVVLCVLSVSLKFITVRKGVLVITNLVAGFLYDTIPMMLVTLTLRRLKCVNPLNAEKIASIYEDVASKGVNDTLRNGTAPVAYLVGWPEVVCNSGFRHITLFIASLFCAFSLYCSFGLFYVCVVRNRAARPAIWDVPLFVGFKFLMKLIIVKGIVLFGDYPLARAAINVGCVFAIMMASYKMSPCLGPVCMTVNNWRSAGYGFTFGFNLTSLIFLIAKMATPTDYNGLVLPILLICVALLIPIGFSVIMFFGAKKKQLLEVSFIKEIREMVEGGVTYDEIYMHHEHQMKLIKMSHGRRNAKIYGCVIAFNNEQIKETLKQRIEYFLPLPADTMVALHSPLVFLLACSYYPEGVKDVKYFFLADIISILKKGASFFDTLDLSNEENLGKSIEYVIMPIMVKVIIPAVKILRNIATFSRFYKATLANDRTTDLLEFLFKLTNYCSIFLHVEASKSHEDVLWDSLANFKMLIECLGTRSGENKSDDREKILDMKILSKSRTVQNLGAAIGSRIFLDNKAIIDWLFERKILAASAEMGASPDENQLGGLVQKMTSSNFHNKGPTTPRNATNALDAAMQAVTSIGGMLSPRFVNKPAGFHDDPPSATVPTGTKTPRGTTTPSKPKSEHSDSKLRESEKSIVYDHSRIESDYFEEEVKHMDTAVVMDSKQSMSLGFHPVRASIKNATIAALMSDVRTHDDLMKQFDGLLPYWRKKSHIVLDLSKLKKLRDDSAKGSEPRKSSPLQIIRSQSPMTMPSLADMGKKKTGSVVPVNEDSVHSLVQWKVEAHLILCLDDEIDCGSEAFLTSLIDQLDLSSRLRKRTLFVVGVEVNDEEASRLSLRSKAKFNTLKVSKDVKRDSRQRRTTANGRRATGGDVKVLLDNVQLEIVPLSPYFTTSKILLRDSNKNNTKNPFKSLEDTATFLDHIKKLENVALDFLTDKKEEINFFHAMGVMMD